MADKKKMSVADILAAARKTDGGDDRPQEEAAPPVKKEAEQAAEKPAAAKPAASSGERPNVSDILAAARGEKATPKKGAPKKEAPKSAAPVKGAAKAAAKPAAKSPAASGAKGPRDTASILAAARKDAKPGPMSKAEAAAQVKAPVAAKEKLTAPPMPAKPDYAKPKGAKPTGAKPKGAKAEVDEGRRTVILGTILAIPGLLLGSSLAIGFTSLTASLGLWTLASVRFMFPNVLREPPSQFKVGFPGDFAPGQVETKYKAEFGVWIVNGEYNGEPQLYALKSVCTHLGCTPNWLEAEQKFKCPCHGSGFYKDGINFEGPAPRPLERYAISLADDGQVMIDKSSLFQEEMGQWADAASFISV